MQVSVLVGDVFEYGADVLICSANPWLNMSGGVGGEILRRTGHRIQAELRNWLASTASASVAPGTVFCTSAGDLPFRHILHAVAIDPFYESSLSLVETTLERAFDMARTIRANSLAMPALATGYGRLSIEVFGQAFAAVLKKDWSPLHQVNLVVRSEENAKLILRQLGTSAARGGDPRR